MDRDDLLGLLGCLEDDTLSVRPDGTLVTDCGNSWPPGDVTEAVAELTAELAKLIAWAKLAPKYTAPPVTTSDENGNLFDEDGLPL